MATLYEMDAANLFCDDLDPTMSQFLALEEIKIPALHEKTHDHVGGGAAMVVKLGMGIFEQIELTFKLRGVNPDVMSKIMSPTRSRRKYTITGNIRDLEGGRQFPLKAVVEGRMTKADMGTFKRDAGLSTDYQIQEIVHYELWLDGREKYYLNAWTGPLGTRVDGQAIYAEMARNLGLA